MSKGKDKLTEKAYIALVDFHDINNYAVVYKKDEYVEGFDHDRIKRAMDNGLIKEVTREVK